MPLKRRLVANPFRPYGRGVVKRQIIVGTRGRALRSAFTGATARYGLGAAGGLGAGVMAYGAYRGYRRIQRARRRARGRRKLGYSTRRREPCKSRLINNTDITTKVGDRVHGFELTSNLLKSDQQNSTLRNSNICNISGWKIVKNFKNNDSAPLCITVAVIASKNMDDAVTENFTNEFFRESADSRTSDWDYTTLSDVQMRTYAINTDKWIVLDRQQHWLESSSCPDEKRRFWEYNKYIKFNRRLHYDSATAKPEHGRVFVVYWLNKNQRDPGSTAPTISVAQQQYVKVYFREPLSH